MIDKEQITGLILAGGRGTRMGGADKGLQQLHGIPMALHVLLRLGPQVGSLMINANRNLSAYESMGASVWPDNSTDFAGPLAGIAVGLERCETPYLMTVPCDTPVFPEDMVQRLAEALEREGAEIAMVHTRENGELRSQPVFSLMSIDLLPSLVLFLTGGEHKVGKWMSQHRCAAVEFPDPHAFRGANTMIELRELHQGSST